MSGTELVEGLTSSEVEERIRDGRVNAVAVRTSRTSWDIVRTNVFTWFNLILGVLWVLMVTFGSVRDALFGLVLLFNTAIGIVQEVRAKLALDRLSLVTAPKARVVRDGALHEIGIGEVVLDDTVYLESGDQIVADGEVLWTEGLEADESLLTGESLPVVKAVGDHVMAGTFIVAGKGAFHATSVGEQTRAHQITVQGKLYTRVRSEVMDGINSILKLIGVAMVPVAILTVAAAFRTTGTVGVRVTDVVATLVAMVPEGLVLLSSISFAAAMVVLARKNVLANELAAVEVLARTDVICVDKTGTITEPHPAFDRFEPAPDMSAHPDAIAALGALTMLEGPSNSTAATIRKGVGDNTEWVATANVPFSSKRKWSAAEFEGHGTWILGAPDVLTAALPAASEPLRDQTAALSTTGLRILLLARTDDPLPDEGLPSHFEPVGFAVLAEKIRSDAGETARYLGEEGIVLKVVSGDSVHTVSAIAQKAGIPHAEDAIDARTLPEGEELADVMERTTVFGRVAPEQKALMVEALQSRGHTVGMTGDGVNDVLAVKSADLGIAMGSGAAATKAVAQIVLLDGRFSVMPLLMAEGRRVIANAERVANLFLTKTVWATVLALLFGLFAEPYPFLPRQLTLVGSLIIGIPALFLALSPNTRRYSPGFVQRVARFAIPTGLVLAGVIVTTYFVTRSDGVSLAGTRTACSLALLVMGLFVIGVLEHPLRGWHVALLATMAAAMVLALAVPPVREFFAFTTLSPREYAQTLSIAGFGCGLFVRFGIRARAARKRATAGL